MEGSRLFGGKLSINRSSPLVRRTALRPLSPITSWAEVSAWRTSELMMTASSLAFILPPHSLVRTLRRFFSLGSLVFDADSTFAMLSQVTNKEKHRTYIRDTLHPYVRIPSAGTGLRMPGYHSEYLPKVLKSRRR